MKRRVAVVFAIVVFGLGILYILLTLAYPTPPVMPSYHFVGDQPAMQHGEKDVHTWPRFRVWTDAYSFPADFNSVRDEAGRELSGLGYANMSRRGQGPWNLVYYYSSPRGDRIVTVRINEDCRLTRHPETQQVTSGPQPGWIMVEVELNDRDFRLWKDVKTGPAALLRRMRGL